MGENGSGEITLVKLLTRSASYSRQCWSAHRNLRIAHFMQHHVDQLVMDTTSLELIQSRLPGRREEEYRHQLGSFGISSDLVAFALIVMFLYWIWKSWQGPLPRLPLFQDPNGLWAHQISRDWVPT